MKKSVLCLMTLLLIGYSSWGFSAALGQRVVTFKYCYESKEFLPHFTGAGRDVPENRPGASIEVLRELDQRLPEIKIHYVRYPWKRCLSELASGKIHGAVGSHTSERESYLAYPRVSGKVDHTKAFSKSTSCFVHLKKKKLQWDGVRLDFDMPMVMALPRGYQSVKDFQSYGFKIYEADSIESAYALLEKRRVDATLSNCEREGIPNFIIQNPHPINARYGHLMISKAFFEQYPTISEAMWNTLDDIDIPAFYKKYANP